MRSERCKKCKDEDTKKCDDCKLVMEIKLAEIPEAEKERIEGGKPIAK